MSDNSLPEVTLTWTHGLQFVGHAHGSNHAVVLDGKVEHGGDGSGVRPMEALLISLGSCTGMDTISVLQKKRQRVSNMQVLIRSECADEHPKRYTHIELEFLVEGWHLSESAVQRAVELSQTKYCPVTATLNCPVDYTIRLVELATSKNS